MPFSMLNNASRQSWSNTGQLLELIGRGRIDINPDTRNKWWRIIFDVNRTGLCDA
jgi:hypothetical protein